MVGCLRWKRLKHVSMPERRICWTKRNSIQDRDALVHLVSF